MIFIKNGNNLNLLNIVFFYNFYQIFSGWGISIENNHLLSKLHSQIAKSMMRYVYIGNLIFIKYIYI